MSTTPRTNAQILRYRASTMCPSEEARFEGAQVVPADFARDLELENNDLREVLNKLTDSYFLHRCEGMLELMLQADRLRPLDMEGDK